MNYTCDDVIEFMTCNGHFDTQLCMIYDMLKLLTSPPFILLFISILVIIIIIILRKIYWSGRQENVPTHVGETRWQ